jgi:hypothetical protein
VTLAAVDKARLLEELVARLEIDLENVTAAQKAAQEGATHEENRSESDKDMRATEVSYLARGQAERVISLREELGVLRGLVLRKFGVETPLSAGALVHLDDGERVSLCWLLPAGAGERFALPGGGELRVVTPRSPLGQSLLGLVQGDVCGLDTAEGSREYEIVEVA